MIVKGDTCIKISKDNETVVMQTCPNDKHCFAKTDEPNENAFCIEIPKDGHKGYPGMTCKENSDCFSNSCINNVCIGVKENERCPNVEDCEYGFICRKVNDVKICTVPLEEGTECTNDTECKLTHGCYKNKCTPYFSML